jgi:mono/diheme cytochrome c family protein
VNLSEQKRFLGKWLVGLVASTAVLTGCARAPAEKTGAQLFAAHCAACHGTGGEGDGPVSLAMRVRVANLRNLKLRNDGIFPADAVTEYLDGRHVPVSHGDAQQPVWGDVFQAREGQSTADTVRQRIAATVAFIEEQQYP